MPDDVELALAFGEIHATPPAGPWLSERELAVLATLVRAPRRDTWLAGRWLGKGLVEEHLGTGVDGGVALACIEILAADDGAPEVWLDGRRHAWSLSLSHRAGRVAAAFASRPVGVDLEHIEPRSAAFVRDYLTDGEQSWVMALGDDGVSLGANLIWSAKEAALKALRCGLRRDTRSVEVTVGDDRLVVYDSATGATLEGFWHIRDEHIVTVVTASLYKPEGIETG